MLEKDNVEALSLPFAPIHRRTDGSHRLTIPSEFAAHIKWLQGAKPLHAWFWAVSDGRYRVLTEEQVRSDPRTARVLSLLTDGDGGEVVSASEADDDADTAMVARLMQTTIRPSPPMWRILIPEGIRELPPAEYDKERFSMLIRHGHWEIWHREALWRSATRSLKFHS